MPIPDCVSLFCGCASAATKTIRSNDHSNTDDDLTSGHRCAQRAPITSMISAAQSSTSSASSAENQFVMISITTSTSRPSAISYLFIGAGSDFNVRGRAGRYICDYRARQNPYRNPMSGFCGQSTRQPIHSFAAVADRAFERADHHAEPPTGRSTALRQVAGQPGIDRRMHTLRRDYPVEAQVEKDQLQSALQISQAEWRR